MRTLWRAAPVPPEIEFRSAGSGHVFTGYASVFDSPAPMGSYVESVAPGAFSRTLGIGRDHTFVINHDERSMSNFLASTQAGHLRLAQDARGLVTESTLPDTAAVRDLRELHARGEVRGMSFTFGVAGRGTKAPGETWTTVDGMRQRRLTDLNLGHVTVLVGAVLPAYEATTAEIRSLADALDVEPDAIPDILAPLFNAEPAEMRDALGDWIAERSIPTPVAPAPAPARVDPVLRLRLGSWLEERSLSRTFGPESFAVRVPDLTTASREAPGGSADSATEGHHPADAESIEPKENQTNALA